ncbi:MAG: L-2-amino-thiazoline-4-carboxylic acid hydrolase [Dehalococcoidia bacterium]
MPPAGPSASAGRPLGLSLLQRRGIEAEVLIPFIRRLEVELGPERAHRIARETIDEIAREQGRAVAEGLGRTDLEGFHAVRDTWSGAGGDLTIETLREDGERLEFNVTRCRFAELYERLGARDLGFLLSCGRDFTLSEGYSPDLELERSQTIMQGAPFCDFRYRYRAPSAQVALPGDADDSDNAAGTATAGPQDNQPR